jgi:hypothetical protein
MPQDSSKNLEGSINLDEMSIRDIFDYDLPDMEVTEEVREKCKYSKKYGIGARGFKGLFYTSKEDNARRRRIRLILLP